MRNLIVLGALWVWLGLAALAQQLPTRVTFTVESFPPSQVYMETATHPTYLGRSGQNLTVTPPVMTDQQGHATQYLNGFLVLRAEQHADFRITVGAQDWAKGRFPPEGGSYSLTPQSSWVAVRDYLTIYPLRSGLVVLGLLAGLVAAWRWRGLALARGRENSLLSGQLKSTGDPLVGKMLGRYTVKARLGQGGMGTVYRVCDSEGGEYAAKVLYFSESEGAELNRFRREFRVISQLHHPALVRGFDYGEEEGLAYGVMELVQGKTLNSFIEPGGSPWERVWPWVRSILQGLSCAHAQGVVHRDLKPANIMIGAEGLKILDFGLARQSQGTVVTVTGKGMGTPAYLAPEQISATGTEIEPRTDIYSLGVIIFELLTGRRPFEAEDPGELIAKHCSQPPPLPSEFVQGISPKLERVILTMLAKRPANRYPSVDRLLAVLSELETGPGASSSKSGEPAGEAADHDAPTAALPPKS